MAGVALPRWHRFTRTPQVSPRVLLIVSAFIGDGCLAGAAGLRHHQHPPAAVLLLCVRVRGVGFFFLDFFVSPRV